MPDSGAAEVPQKRIRLPLKLLISLANQEQIVLRYKNENFPGPLIFLELSLTLLVNEASSSVIN